MVSYKHYTQQLLFFLHEILIISIIIVSYHNASFHWYYLCDVICCSINPVLNSYTDYLFPRPELCGPGPLAKTKKSVQNGHINRIWCALSSEPLMLFTWIFVGHLSTHRNPCMQQSTLRSGPACLSSAWEKEETKV